MMNGHSTDWNVANQRYLMAAIGVIQAELEVYQPGKDEAMRAANDPSAGSLAKAELLLTEAAALLDAPAALEVVVKAFGLSSFERKIILLCAGVELSSDFSNLISTLQRHANPLLPSFSLAMAVFGDAHWSAISPAEPLRYWRLVHLQDHPLLTRSPMRIDEHLLHFLAGLNGADERFNEVFVPLHFAPVLAQSQLLLSKEISGTLANGNESTPMPVVLLNGDEADKAAIAGEAASSLGFRVMSVSAYSIPVGRKELTELIRLWNRHAILNSYALFVDCSELDLSDKARVYALEYFMDSITGLLLISTGSWSPKTNRKNLVAEVKKPTRVEQNWLWQDFLNDKTIPLNGQLDKLVSHFDLSARTIRQVSAEIVSSYQNESSDKPKENTAFTKRLWKLCCQHSRPHVDDLAQRIEPVAVWDNLVLPDSQKDILREIAMQVKQRKKVYDEWGFAATSSRGLGITAMFTGESGTGKTMSAEVLANELQLDLYRIDLSQVVNKYIGETEKNLKRVFDAAEEGGAILLFDEADALFGKRSEVKDSHDRYGNIEVSYLLQRMEAYRGLAILTTNMKGALDKAFLRRIRFVVQFPFPGAAQRMEIWSKVFPAHTPVGRLDLDKLARLSLPGGNIRNIAMNAAFIAAEEQMPVGMSQILRAARSEYNKLDKAMNTIES